VIDNNRFDSELAFQHVSGPNRRSIRLASGYRPTDSDMTAWFIGFTNGRAIGGGER